MPTICTERPPAFNAGIRHFRFRPKRTSATGDRETGTAAARSSVWIADFADFDICD
jgi:hypothetical protein